MCLLVLKAIDNSSDQLFKYIYAKICKKKKTKTKTITKQWKACKTKKRHLQYHSYPHIHPTLPYPAHLQKSTNERPNKTRRGFLLQNPKWLSFFFFLAPTCRDASLPPVRYTRTTKWGIQRGSKHEPEQMRTPRGRGWAMITESDVCCATSMAVHTTRSNKRIAKNCPRT